MLWFIASSSNFDAVHVYGFGNAGFGGGPVKVSNFWFEFPASAGEMDIPQTFVDEVS